jgi:hypothetical protein
MSEMRKFVFVFTGPAVNGKGVRCEDVMLGLTRFAERTFGWQTLETHCVPLDTPVRVGDVAPSQSDRNE